jgi:class 3 adenylate cyclase
MKSIEPADFFPRLAAYAKFDAGEYLTNVQAPTLILHRPAFHGSHVNVARRLAARMADARLILLEGESVVPFIGDTGAVMSGIDDFLDRGVARAAARAGAVETVRKAPQGMQALLFTDIEGHTAIMQRLGDDRGRSLLREHEQITRAALRASGGTEIKTMGDGFMASFGSVRGALECAIALQRGFDRANRDPGSSIGAASASGTPLRVRIGVNAGEPLSEDDDLFGASVIAVARIAAEARGGEILVADVVRQLAAGKQFVFVDRGEVTLRGFDEPLRLHELRWKSHR